MKKRSLLFLSLLIVIFSLIGCSNSETANTEDDLVSTAKKIADKMAIH